MLIVLDYDETYTECPVLWDRFIIQAKQHGHDVICCTMRHDDGYNDDVLTAMGMHDVAVVFSAPHKDKWEAIQKAGYVPENAIWIDDRPMYIYMNRDFEDL